MEPDDTKHLENCAAINIQATVSDEDCTERHGYICEYFTTSKYTETAIRGQSRQLYRAEWLYL